MKQFKRLWAVAAGMCLLAGVGAFAATQGAQGRASGPIPAMKARLAAKVPMTGLVSAGSALVAVGDYGTVVRSTDGGKTWQQAEVPVSTLLTAVHFVDALHGWAVGHGGVVLASADGGASWSLQNVLDDKPVLLSVHFTDSQRGYAVGAYGAAFVTQDGGKRWETMAVGSGSDADLHLNQVFATRQGTLFIAGEAGVAFRSTDRGGSWHKLATGVSGSLWSGFERADGEVLLLGMSGKVIVSRDAGEHWDALATGTEQSLTSAIALPDGGLMAVGAGGVVLRSDGTGPIRTEIRPDRQNLAAVIRDAGGTVVLAGQQGVERGDTAH